MEAPATCWGFVVSGGCVSKARVALVPLLLASCGGTSGPSGTDLPLPGFYTGTLGGVTPREVGDGTARIQLEVGGAGQLSGSWLFDFSSGAYRRGGSLRGTAAGGRLELSLLPERDFDCEFAIRASTESGNRIVGTFASVSCQLDLRGRIDLARGGP